jgi:hypothetical protein
MRGIVFWYRKLEEKCNKMERRRENESGIGIFVDEE